MSFEGEERPLYSKEEIEEKMRKLREERVNREKKNTPQSSSSPSSSQPLTLKTKRPFGEKLRTAFKKSAKNTGDYVKKKIDDARDVDLQTQKTVKKAKLIEAKTRLKKAERRLKKEQKLTSGNSDGMLDFNTGLFGEQASSGNALDFGLNFGSSTKKARKKNPDPFNLNLDFGI